MTKPVDDLIADVRGNTDVAMGSADLITKIARTIQRVVNDPLQVQEIIVELQARAGEIGAAIADNTNAKVHPKDEPKDDQ